MFKFDPVLSVINYRSHSSLVLIVTLFSESPLLQTATKSVSRVHFREKEVNLSPHVICFDDEQDGVR